MAIAFDAFSSGGGTGASPKSWSHTCTGQHRILIVTLMTQSGSDTITGVTYNGVSMTAISSTARSSMFYLLNPATGSNTVEVSYSNFSGNGISGCSNSYTGVAGIGASGVSSPAGNPQTQAVTTTSDNSWLVGMTGVWDDETAFGAGSGTTVRGSSAHGGAQLVTSHDSNGAKSPTGSYSLNTTGTILGSGARMIVAEITLGPVDYSVSFTHGAFTLTGQVLIFLKGFYIAIAQGVFSLTGQALSPILNLYTRVTNRVKNTTTVTNRNKTVSASVTNKVKNVTTVTNRQKT